MAIRNTKALSFNGTSSFLRFQDNSKLVTGANARTVMFWVKPSVATYGQVVFSYGDTQSVKEFSIYINGINSATQGMLVIGAYDNAIATPVGVTPIGVWTHVAVEYNTGSLANANTKVFINGVQQTLSTPSGYTSVTALNTTNTAFYVGKRIDNTSFFNGQLDELSYWNINLTQTQIQDYMNRILVGNETNLVNYWRFEEGNGNITLDKTANNVHAELVNTTFVDTGVNLNTVSGGTTQDVGVGLNLQSGTYYKTSYVNGALQLNYLGKDPLGNDYYEKFGTWESDTIILGDNVNSFKRIAKILTVSGSYKIFTSSSLDGLAWTNYVEVSANFDILSPMGKYVKVKVELYAPTNDITYDVDTFSTNKWNNQYLDVQGDLKLKKSYSEIGVRNTTWSESGTVHVKRIEKTKFKKIDSINVL
jgi:hypothetical protein